MSILGVKNHLQVPDFSREEGSHKALAETKPPERTGELQNSKRLKRLSEILYSMAPGKE